MKRFPTLSLFILLPVFLSAQFSIRYDSIVSLSTATSSFVKNSNGNCFIFSFSGDTTGYLAKTDSTGSLLFSNRLHYPTGALGLRIVETSDTNYLTLSHVPTLGNIIQFAKFDPSGNLTWTKCLSSFAYSGVSPTAMCATTNGGGVIVGGGCNSSNMTTRFDVNGNLMWQYQYKDTALTFSNNVDIAPYGNDFILLDAGISGVNYFPAVLKIDSAGNVLWCTRYYTAGTCLPARIIKTNDGGLIIGGKYSPTNSTYHTFLTRTDSAGTILWSRLYDCGSDNRLTDIMEVPAGGFIFTSVNGNNLATTRVDSLGNVTWSRKLPFLTYIATGFVTDAGNGNFYTAGGARVQVSNLVYNRLWLNKSSVDTATSCTSTPLQYTVTTFPLTLQASHIQRVNLVFVPTTGLLTSDTISLVETAIVCPPIVTGINSHVNDQLHGIFPNPVTGNTILRSAVFISNGNFKLYDVAGQLVLIKNVFSSDILLEDCSALMNGVYFIEVNADGNRFMEKLMICH